MNDRSTPPDGENIKIEEEVFYIHAGKRCKKYGTGCDRLI